MPRQMAALVPFLFLAPLFAVAVPASAQVVGAVVVGDGVVVTTAGGTQTAPGVVPSPGGPPRDNQLATGRSTLRGRLTDAATGAPLRRASIRVTAPELRGARMVTTDVDGRYDVAELPAGHYMLTASKPGYVDMSFGQAGPNEFSPPVTLADRQTLEKLDIALPRGGVITGRVLDEFGEPLTGATVSSMRLQYTPGGRRPISAGRTGTANDVGEFRIFGLVPGRYYLIVTVPSQAFVMNGVAATTDRAGYAPTYYPAASRFEDAQPINIGAGETISDLVIGALAATTSRISGSVLDAQGQGVAQGFVNAMPMNGSNYGMGGSQIINGRFTLNGITPGDYVLRATLGMPTQGQPPQMAVATVSVNGGDIDGVVLAPTVPVTLHGRLVVAPGATASGPRQPPRVTYAPMNPFAAMMIFPSTPALVRDDLSFDLNATPGDIIIRPALGPGWLAREVRLNGRDVTSGFALRPDETGMLEIEITDRLSTLAGTVTNRRGEAATSYTVIAFPQDSRQWATPSPNHSAMVRPTADGSFTIRTLLPDDFYIVAVDRVQNGEWTDPEFLERVRSSATAIRLGEGDSQTISLRLLEQPR